MEVLDECIIFQVDKVNMVKWLSEKCKVIFPDILGMKISDIILDWESKKSKSTITIRSCKYNFTKISAIDETVYYFLVPLDVNNSSNIFIAKASHELKTLLNGIIGMTELLNDTIMTAQQIDYMDTINQCSQQLLSVINDILDLSKIKSGTLKLNLEPFNIQQCVEEAMDIMALKAEKKGLLLYHNPVKSSNVSYVVMDKSRLRQILINLLDNAIKFTEKGEVSVSYEVDKSDKDNIIFYVSDTGCGIVEESKKTIFNEFIQGSNINYNANVGSGLGLSIVKKLINMMGGEISVESELNKGTKFIFNVKSDASVDNISEKHIIHEDKSLSDKKVLIVDDKPANRTIIMEYVLKWYMKPITCGSASEAMSYINNNYHFDIALIDVQMPDIDGLKLAEKIREIFPALPIVAITSLLDNPMDKVSFLTDAISKPIKSTKLYTVLMRILNKGYETKYSKEIVSSEKRKTRILLVEDVRYNQDIMVGLLKKLGYTNIIKASSGMEALSVLHAQNVDIIFMDISMTPMNGIQATKEILKMYPSVVMRPLIIAMTAFSNDETRRECLSSGMSAYLIKPIEGKKLKVMMDLLEKKLNY